MTGHEGKLTEDNSRGLRQMRLAHLRNRFKSASETARPFRIPISRQTVMRRLRAYGLKCLRPVRRPILTQTKYKAMLNWAQAHRRWPLRMWEDIVFSDESRFYLDDMMLGKEYTGGLVNVLLSAQLAQQGTAAA